LRVINTARFNEICVRSGRNENPESRYGRVTPSLACVAAERDRSSSASSRKRSAALSYASSAGGSNRERAGGATRYR